MLISIAIAAYLFHALFSNFPFRLWPGRVFATVNRVATWCGLEYNWSMYAPEAPTTSDLVEVYLEVGDQSTNVTPEYLNVLGDYGRTPSLRFVTFQRRLMGDDAEPVRLAICSEILRSRKLGGPSGDRQPGREAGAASIVFKVVRIATPQFFTPPSTSERDVEFIELARYSVGSTGCERIDVD